MDRMCETSGIVNIMVGSCKKKMEILSLEFLLDTIYDTTYNIRKVYNKCQSGIN